MFNNTLARFWSALVRPQVRLPADFPFSPAASGKLYLKSLACYIIGTLVPMALFMGLCEYAVNYNPALAVALFDETRFPLVLAVVSAITFLSGFGAQLLYVRGQIQKQGKSLSDVLALNIKSLGGSVPKLLGLGVVTFLVAAAAQQLAAALWPLQIEDTTAKLINSMGGLSFAVMALLAVTAPIFEEVIFRGFLYNSIRTALHKRNYRYADLAACFFSALVFGLVHMNLAGLPLYVVTGMVFAEAYRRSGSLYVPVLGHFINNGLLMLIMLFAK